ncbi:Ger(x)C family spore germination protein [Bacillus safensis]|uniref:Ger(x)C family spore germination protein n=1 Tax=Bacillus safensis TaxID=561879 RepID=UPI002283168E|nr:Ger(x)C family spore germination protein [Bacillus safensis]MCY7625205.1 Ger(x)C family spore germination protein [Bacillus safensis]MCY7631576.1 Ger(x)C family spore germination protein [Bacillus safensis]MCY7654002.1 Ger(x)C family spore germination protein [Bacillus safensis]MCY7661637.1 Ger(x)C family spore germination protein [Bacillus safensis]MCY7663791.1 Ger(x)C family spore germination protein [Bacillus safensis]
MKQYVLIGLMLFNLLLTSCAQPRLLDELNISQAAGFDLMEDGEMKGFFVFPVFKSEEQGSYQILSAKSNTISNIQFLVSEKSPFPVVMGQVLVILVSEKLAKEVGMIDLMNYIYRDPIIGSRQVFAIVGGEVEELLYTKMNQTNLNIGVYLSDLLAQNMRNGNEPVTNQHIFMNQMMAKGVDAYLPYIKRTSNAIKVSGVALFDQEKMVGHIPGEDTFTFKAMIENHKNGIYEFQLHDRAKTNVVIENIKSHVSYQIKPTKNLTKKPHITIDIKLKGELKEFMKSKRIDKPNILDQVEKEVEKRITQQGEDLVQSFKKQNIDPLGLGLRYRSKDKAMTPEKWQDIYPDVNVKVKCRMKIVQTGVSQ